MSQSVTLMAYLWLCKLLIVCIGLNLVLGVKIDKLDKAPKNENANENRKKVDKLLDDLDKKKVGEKVKGENSKNGLKKVKSVTMANGDVETDVQQEYDGYEVFGCEIRVHEIKGKTVEMRSKDNNEKTGEVVKVKATKEKHGKLCTNLEDELSEINTESLNAQLCLTTLKNQYPGATFTNEQTEIIVYVDQKEEIAFWAYKCQLEIEQGTNPVIIVSIEDPTTIVLAYDLVNNALTEVTANGPGGNEKTGQKTYNNLKAMQETGTNNCYTKNSKLRVIDNENLMNTDYFNKDARRFDCSTNNGDSANGGFSPSNDALYYGTKVKDMMKHWYGDTRLDANVDIVVRYGNTLNAFAKSNYAVISNGGSTYHPLTTLDVIGHEFAHILIMRGSGLIYAGQSGGLNEAFADMVGKAAERYVNGYSSNTFNWWLGATAVKRNYGNGLRRMDTPFSPSISTIQAYTEGMGVHYSSGIFGKVFYELATTFAYNLWDALDIFYYAEKTIWTSSTTFLQAAESTFDIMKKLKQGGVLTEYQYPHMQYSQLVSAYAKVGITCAAQSDGTYDCTS